METTLSILIVDDNRSWRDALSEYLRDKGFTVAAASDPVQALTHLRADRALSLCICDYRMPGVGGLELVRHVRDFRGDLPVILMSDDDETSLPRRALTAGACAFVPKSSSPQALLNRIRQVVQSTEKSRGSIARLEVWQRLLPSPQRLQRQRNFARRRQPRGTGLRRSRVNSTTV